MRKILLFIYLSLGLISFAQDNSEWSKYSFGKMCTISIPSSMELRDQSSETGKILTEGHNLFMLNFGANLPFQRIVFQPKGMNSSDRATFQAANGKYSRVIVELMEGGISQADIRYASQSDLDELNQAFYENYTSDLKKMGGSIENFKWTPLRRVMYSDKYAVVLHFVRPGLSGGVNVTEYRFFMGDTQLRVTVSYRESESNLWASDFSKIISTIKFK